MSSASFSLGFGGGFSTEMAHTGDESNTKSLSDAVNELDDRVSAMKLEKQASPPMT